MYNYRENALYHLLVQRGYDMSYQSMTHDEHKTTLRNPFKYNNVCFVTYLDKYTQWYAYLDSE